VGFREGCVASVMGIDVLMGNAEYNLQPYIHMKWQKIQAAENSCYMVCSILTLE
jgi:hypothetical protein